MLFKLLLLCIALSQYQAFATENVWIDPIESNLTSLWKIVVTPNTTNPISTSSLYYLYSNVINEYAYNNYKGNYTNLQWSIDSQALLNNEWTPITFYTASDSTLIFLNSSITLSEINFTISPSLVTSTYNSTCASGVLDTFGYSSSTDTFNITANLLNTNDPDNCSITNTGFSPCSDDDDCSDGLVCNTNFLSSFSKYFTQDYKLFYPKKWCTAPHYPEPYNVASLSAYRPLNITENFEETMDSLITVVKESFSNRSSSSICGTYPMISIMNTSNLFDTSLQGLYVNFDFMNMTLDCQDAFYSYGSSKNISTSFSQPISYGCLNNRLLSTNKVFLNYSQYTLPSLYNYYHDCDYPSKGLVQCQVTNDCSEGFECAVFSAFSTNNTLKDMKLCQTGPVISNMYNFNISIVPTDDNDDTSNIYVNYIYLQEAKKLIDEHLLINDCLFADSVVELYIPDTLPYQTASYFVYHINESQVCTDALDYFSDANFSQISDQFSTYITPVQYSDVQLQDCIDGFGDMIMGSNNCNATKSASDPITQCTTNADCDSPQVCQEINGDGESYHVCIHTVNLVKYSISISNNYDSITEVAELVIDWIKDNDCWSNSTVISKYFPLQKPYTTGYIYATNAVTSGSCANDLNPSFIGSGGSVNVTELTNNFDVSTCVANDKLLCKPSYCSQYIECDNGLFSDCSNNSTCTAYNSTFYCNEEYSICGVSGINNSGYTIHANFMILFTILSIGFFF